MATAKKAPAKTKKAAVEQVIETPVVSKKQEIKKPTWEIKDRTYLLQGNSTPLTFTLQSRHTRRYPLLYFDKDTAEQKELRYATNHTSPFVQEQKGEATLGHIIFKDGILTVPKEKQNLQKLLSLYHPLKDKLYSEFSPVEVAEDDLEILDVQIDALNIARDMDIDQAEGILRTEMGSKVSKISSKELKRDLLLFARQKPYLFLELANDENVQLRNVAIIAAENGIISLSQDQRTFTWASNGAKLMTVPFDENPYSAMAAFFKTDEGVQVFKSIEKKLK